MRGRLLKRLLESREEGKLHFTLIDPDKTTPEEASKLAFMAAEAGSDAILVGGSLGVSQYDTDDVVGAMKDSGLPIILFPGSLANASRKADAVLFLSVLNSDNPYFMGIAQIQGALLALKLGLEPIPTSYIIVGYGGAAGFMSRARPIPYDKPELVAAHSLAGAYLGSSLIYLEAGSGAPQPVPPESVALSRKLLDMGGASDVLLTVGGGVRSPETARKLAEAGADIIVTGSLVEESPEKLSGIVKALKSVHPR